MEDVKEDEEEIRQIYSLYTINFIPKLGKEIYHSNTLRSNNFGNIEGVCHGTDTNAVNNPYHGTN